MKSWQLQDAKAHLSQVVQEAIHHGPQEISLRGEPAVVVMSAVEYDKLIHPKPSFIQFLQDSPLVEGDIPLTRDQSLTRKTKL